jgi:hypothetical protein
MTPTTANPPIRIPDPYVRLGESPIACISLAMMIAVAVGTNSADILQGNRRANRWESLTYCTKDNSLSLIHI